MDEDYKISFLLIASPVRILTQRYDDAYMCPAGGWWSKLRLRKSVTAQST